MSVSYFSGLDLAAYSIGGANLLGVLQDCTIKGENTEQNAKGVADRYDFNQAVKQGQTIEFTHFIDHATLGTGFVASNLDVSVWSIGGTNYLANLQSFDLSITNATKERSGVASAYKYPNLVGTSCEITIDHLVINTAALTELLLTGTESQFSVVAALTQNGQAFSAPMSLKSAAHTIKREEMQMENVTLSLQGTPTGPTDTSLLSSALVGTAAVAVSMNTGANQYNTGASQIAVITRLSMKVKDAAITEISGTLALQGALGVTAS